MTRMEDLNPDPAADDDEKRPRAIVTVVVKVIIDQSSEEFWQVHILKISSGILSSFRISNQQRAGTPSTTPTGLRLV